MPTRKTATIIRCHVYGKSREQQIVEAILSYMDANAPTERTLEGFASFMRGYTGAAGLFDAARAFKALRDAAPDRS